MNADDKRALIEELIAELTPSKGTMFCNGCGEKSSVHSSRQEADECFGRYMKQRVDGGRAFDANHVFWAANKFDNRQAVALAALNGLLVGRTAQDAQKKRGEIIAAAFSLADAFLAK